MSCYTSCVFVSGGVGYRENDLQLMRLNSKEQRDEAGFAIELVRRTIMSHPPYDGWSDEWREALQHLTQAQEILKRTGFYTDDYDPTLAAY